MRSTCQNFKVIFNTVLYFSLILPGVTSYGMGLDEYLYEVQRENLSYKSNNEKSVGLEMQLSEADLAYTPELFVDATYQDTSFPQNPAFYTGMKNKNIAAGISKKFSFGLESKLYYQAIGSVITVPGALPFPMLTDYWDVSPMLELKMPLWSGGFGRNLRSNEESLRKQITAEKYNGEAQSKAVIVEAEANYWKLSLWQEVVQIQEQAFQAAQSILSHVTKQKNMNLSEESDVVQAQALVESKRLELKSANDEKRMAERTFNKYLNREPFQKVGELEKVDYVKLETFSIPEKRPGERADVRALQAQADYASANARLVRERGRPKLDVFGKVSLHGRDSEFSQSSSDAFANTYNTTMFGLNFSVPLFFGKLSDLEKGAIKIQQAALLTKEAAVFNQEQAWVQLTETLKDIRENLKMLTRLEFLQKRKLEVERRRFKQGRTTVFQVLMFEQDYTQASASRARLASDILGLLAQIKLYEPAQGNAL